MDAATALYASAAVLLVIAGAVKVIRPATTAALVEDLGAPTRGPITGTRLTLALGATEIGLGIAALVAEIALVAVAVGGLYVVFAATVWRAMSIGAESCGCFGRVEAPPSWLHVIGNLVLAACSFVAAAGRSPLEVMEDQPAAGIGFVVMIGVLAGLELVFFTALPEALEARKPTRAIR
ncbi:MAG: MauE/DoxX family redox-associated membrane protein [Actinomycetota bacterium]